MLHFACLHLPPLFPLAAIHAYQVVHWSIIEHAGIVSEPLGPGTTFSQGNHPVVADLLSSGVILNKLSLDEAQGMQSKPCLDQNT